MWPTSLATSPHMLSLPAPICNQHVRTIEKKSNVLDIGERGRIKVTVWPSGDFTIGMASPMGRRKNPLRTVGDRPAPDSYPAIGDMDEARSQLEEKTLLRLISFYTQEGDLQRVADLENRLEVLRQHMGLVDASNSHNESRRYSKSGITPYGKRIVKSGAVVLSKSFPGRVAFGTLTLPTLTGEELTKICEAWPDLVRKFFQELVRQLERSQLPTEYCYVSEIQEKRFKQWGQVCPHLHFLYVGKQSRFQKSWEIPKEWFRDTWSRLLSNCLGREVSTPLATRVEGAKGNLLAELGKYMSKGGQTLKAIHDRGLSHLLPRSYWGIQKDLRMQVKRSILSSRSKVVETLIDDLPHYQKLGWLKYRPILAAPSDEVDGSPPGQVWGFTGWMKVEKIAAVLETAAMNFIYSGQTIRTA